MKRIIQISEPCVGNEELEALRAPLESGWLTQGPQVNAFEKEFASKHDVKHAFAVTSCTTGLHMALVALGVGPGDEVIVPAFTWVATANAALYCGATPVFVDIDPITFNMDPNQLKKSITKKTKAIIPVHLFGLNADIDAIRAILSENIFIIEDAACAAGGKYKGRATGSLGDVGVFSFHPRKSITTGEGGMVTTNNSELAERLEMLRNHGASISEEVRHKGPKPYLLPEFNLVGYNYRMTDLQGAIGRVQLRKLNNFIEERAKWAAWYREQLSKIDWLQLPNEPIEGRHAWQAFVTYVKSNAPMPRDEIMERLQSQGISTRPGTHAVPFLGYYKERYGYQPNHFPVAHQCYQNSMAIPLHNKMSLEDYQHVVTALSSIK